MIDQTKRDSGTAPSLAEATIAELRRQAGYSPDEEGSVDSLIAYKDALEDRLISTIDDEGQEMSQIYLLASADPFLVAAEARPEVMLQRRMEQIAGIAEGRMAEAGPTEKAARLEPGTKIRFEGRIETLLAVVDWSDSPFPDMAAMVGLVLEREGGSIERAVHRELPVRVIA